MKEPTIKELQEKIEKLKAIKIVWDSKKTEKEICYNCYGDEEKEKEVMKFYDRNYCKEHLEKSKKEIQKKIDDEIAELQEELNFQEKLTKITRFSQLEDMVRAVKTVLKYKEDSWDYKFTEEQKRQGLKLLQLLKKIEPKSSEFIDRGVAINKNLFLAGTVEVDRYSRGENEILLTALDEDEKYRSIARVHLTLREAERLRGLLNECLEHVRIKGMVARIEVKMEIKLKEEEK